MIPAPRARRHPAAPVVAVLATAVVVLSAAGTPAGAHTEVLRASPSPAEEVDAPVDAIELVFVDPVQTGVAIDVTDALGDEVLTAGDVEQSDDRRSATLRLPDLERAGDYVVEYTFTAEDGDTQQQSYRFTIVASERDDESLPVGAIVGSVAAGGVLLAGVAFALLRRRRAG